MTELIAPRHFQTLAGLSPEEVSGDFALDIIFALAVGICEELGKF